VAAEQKAAAIVRLQDGYDHSYFFVSTFMSDHIEFHANALLGKTG
jgi:S-formylglutathione hydrolase